MIKDGEQGRNFLIAVPMLLAEGIVHVVKIKFEKLNFTWSHVCLSVRDCFQLEDLS